MNRMHGIIFAYEQRGELRELTERRTAASIRKPMSLQTTFGISRQMKKNSISSPRLTNR